VGPFGSVGRPARSRVGSSGGLFARVRFQIIPSVSECRRVLYSTKIHWFDVSDRRATASHPDGSCRSWSHYGPVSREPPAAPPGHAARAAGAGTVRFVGDLDPIDLVRVCHAGALPEPIVPSLEYTGNQRPPGWSVCETDRAKSGKTAGASLHSDGTQRRHAGIERMRRLPIDWKQGLLGGARDGVA